MKSILWSKIGNVTSKDIDAFYHIYGIGIKKAGYLNTVDLQIKQIQ